jgi:hypothetical protein
LLLLITGAAGVLPVVIVITLLLALSPHSVIHTAEYVPAPTTIVLPVAFVLHFTLPPQPLAVKVAVSALHKLVLLALIVGTAGLVPTLITIALLLPLAPQKFSHTAVYVPALVTVILVLVALVLHFTLPLVQVAVNTAFPAPQIVILFVAITGAVGFVKV